MPLVLVEALTDEAMERLTHSTDVRVVGVITKPILSVPMPPVAPAPRKWAGSLSDADAASLHAHVKQLRSEWEREF